MSNLLTATADYIPLREALLVQVDLSQYLIDYYLHLKEYGTSITSDHDRQLKELIACFALHLGIRPAEESHAWSLHMHAENPYTLFVAGSTTSISQTEEPYGYIIARAITEDIRHTDVNSFHAQVVSKNASTAKSFVRCESSIIPSMVKHFYDQSEQLPLRINLSKTSDTAIALAALPGYDCSWFETVSLEEISASTETPRKRMRNYAFSFYCDCSPEKLLPYLRSIDKNSLDELYGTDSELTICCPRCGKFFSLERSEIEPGS